MTIDCDPKRLKGMLDYFFKHEAQRDPCGNEELMEYRAGFYYLRDKIIYAEAVDEYEKENPGKKAPLMSCHGRPDPFGKKLIFKIDSKKQRIVAPKSLDPNLASRLLSKYKGHRI
jgi:hypothetical protein